MRANMDDSPWAVVVVVGQQWKLCAFMRSKIGGGFNLVKTGSLGHTWDWLCSHVGLSDFTRGVPIVP